MHNTKIFIYNKTWLESGMANVVQTLHMAQNLNNLASTTIFLRSRKKNYQKEIKKIIGTNARFKCIVNNKSLFTNFLHCLYVLGFCNRKNTIFYSRTVIMCIIATLMGFKSVLELHQDKLGRSEFLSDIFSTILGLSYITSKLKIIVISESLKNIILSKYGIKNKIYVAHDAANAPPKKLLNINFFRSQ